MVSILNETTKQVLTFELKATPKPKNRRVEIKSNPCCSSCCSSAKLSHNNSSAWGEDPSYTRTAFQRSASDRPNLTKNKMMLESSKRCRDTSFMKSLYNFSAGAFCLKNEWMSMWADAVRIRWDIIWHKTLMYIHQYSDWAIYCLQDFWCLPYLDGTQTTPLNSLPAHLYVSTHTHTHSTLP